MATAIPLTITQEAADFIAEKTLHQPFQLMLDNIPKRLPAVHAIAVSLQQPYDLGGGPRVVFDVIRDSPSSAEDPSERHWERWVVENFPPHEFEHLVLLTAYKSK